MGKVKIGIIGCGGIANGKHMPSLSKVSEAEMVAFCDIIPERAEKAAKDCGRSLFWRPVWLWAVFFRGIITIRPGCVTIS